MDGYDAREQAGHEPYGPRTTAHPRRAVFRFFALRAPRYLVATAGVCSGAACPEGAPADFNAAPDQPKPQPPKMLSVADKLLPRLWGVYWFSE